MRHSHLASSHTATSDGARFKPGSALIQILPSLSHPKMSRPSSSIQRPQCSLASKPSLFWQAQMCVCLCVWTSLRSPHVQGHSHSEADTSNISGSAEPGSHSVESGLTTGTPISPQCRLSTTAIYKSHLYKQNSIFWLFSCTLNNQVIDERNRMEMVSNHGLSLAHVSVSSNFSWCHFK